MNLSIEDLEAIKAIVREVIKEELSKLGLQHGAVSTGRQPVEHAINEPNHEEQSQEVVAHIRGA